MYEGDASRKRTLVDHGFRLPSALDNRPAEVGGVPAAGSARPSTCRPPPARTSSPAATALVEQIIRPTGLIDPEVIVKPTEGQIDDLVHEIRKRVEKDERVLVTTLTKKMAEDLTDYLLETGHPGPLPAQRRRHPAPGRAAARAAAGEFDVLVGINLLREGLDLPEVSLVAILDADKEGFLRSGTSLIQTIGRAARNVSGQVHMYADQITPAMETGHRRDQPPPRQADRLQQGARASTRSRCARRSTTSSTPFAREDADTEELLGSGYGSARAARRRCPALSGEGRPRQAGRGRRCPPPNSPI